MKERSILQPEYILEHRFSNEHVGQFSHQTRILMQGVLAAGAKINSISLESLIDMKEGSQNFVTAWDYASESVMMQLFRSLLPHIPILSEESAADTQAVLNQPEILVLDPLDGTTNARYRRGYSCIAASLVRKGQPWAAAVFVFDTNELYYAEDKIGAFLDDKKLQMSTEEQDIKEAAISSDWWYEPKITQFHLSLLAHTGTAAVDIRGSGIRKLCEIADGRYNLYFHSRIQPWDSAAGISMIRNAGGIVQGFDGREVTIFDQDIVAGNKSLVNAFVDLEKRNIAGYRENGLLLP